VLAVKVRHCEREAIRAGRNADRITKGIAFDAIVAVEGRNGWEGNREMLW
jgi:hypothetical protein